MTKTISINESEMTFGPYLKDACFHIEKSKTYLNIKDGVKIAEFLLFKMSEKTKPTIYIVEAKSSSPNPETRINFEGFISEILEKMLNALFLGLSVFLRRHPSTETDIPNQFKTLELSSVQFRFVLVIKGHKKEWLQPIQEALNKALCSIIKIWAIDSPAVAVLNDTLAKQKGYIQ